MKKSGKKSDREKKNLYPTTFNILPIDKILQRFKNWFIIDKTTNRQITKSLNVNATFPLHLTDINLIVTASFSLCEREGDQNSFENKPKYKRP